MFACAQWGAVGEFAASRHGVLTRKQAAAHEMSAKVIARLLAARHLTEPLPGVLMVVGSPATWRQSLLVATLGSNRAGVAAFTSAAALHEIDGFESDSLHLLVPSWRRGFSDDVTLHIGPRDHPGDITEIDGIRCTGIARTLCDLGSVRTVEQTRIAFEWAWRSGHSLTWIRLTAERLHRPGQKGE